MNIWHLVENVQNDVEDLLSDSARQRAGVEERQDDLQQVELVALLLPLRY